MSLTVNSNQAASIANRALQGISSAMDRTLAKLSSGSRVASARDDAASLAIGSRIRGEIASLKTYQQNATQAVSMLQVADGTYARTQDMLIRMRSLAAQAQGSNLSATERGMLDTEFQQLKREIDRMAGATQFGGQSLLGTGSTISLSAATSVTASNITVVSSSLADLNGDGIMDFIFTGASGGLGAVEIKYGNADGTFTTGYTLTGLTGSVQLDQAVTGDFNGDGLLDIFVRHDAGNGRILTNTGNNQFTVTTLVTAGGGMQYQAADINNDGRDDLIGASYFGATTVGVYTSTGNGFTSSNFTVAAGVTGFDIGDTNNDGFLDIVIRTGASASGSYLNDGRGNISSTFTNNGNTLFTGGLRLVDINGDGILDITTEVNGGSFLATQLGLGNGMFSTQSWQFPGTAANIGNAYFLDLNGDGYQDFITTNSDNTIGAQMGTGNGTFGSFVTLATGATYYNRNGMQILDVNNDGRKDIVLFDGVTSRIYYNQSTSGIESNVRVSASSAASSNVAFHTASTRLNFLDSALASSTIGSRGSAVRAEESIINALNRVNYSRTRIGAAINRLEATQTNIATMIENQEGARSAYLDLDVASEMAKYTAQKVTMQAGISMLAQASSIQRLIAQLLQSGGLN